MKLSLVMVLSLLFAPMYAMAQDKQAVQPTPVPADMGSASPQECQKLAGRLGKLANTCLRRKNFAKRKACMDQPSKWNVEERLWQGCRQQIEPIKQNFLAQEKATYPKQASAFGDDDRRDNGRDDRNHQGGDMNHQGGPDHNGGNMAASAQECNKLAKRLHKHANKCLNRKNFAKRKACIDQPSKWNVEERLWQGCRQQIDPLKQVFLSKEKAKYPKQASAFGDDDRRDNGRDDRNHQGGDMNHQGGPDHNGGNMAASAQECNKLAKRLHKHASKCLNRKNFAKRKACIDQPSKWNVEERLWQGCRQQIDPLKQVFLSKEKAKYPKQASAFGDDEKDGNRNPSGDMNHKEHQHQGNMAASPKECNKLANRLKRLANKCLKRKNLSKRQACMDQPSKWNVEERLWQGCRQQIDPIKQSYLSREKAKYPKQASAFDKGEGNDHNGEMNNHGPGHNGGNMGASPKECNKLANRLKKLANKCLNRKNLSKRQACMDQPSKWNVEERLWQGCRQQIDPVKQSYLSREKAKYPKQASAFDKSEGNHHGDQHQANHQGPDHHQGPQGVNPEQVKRCQTFAKVQIRPKGDGCLKRQPASKRKECFDYIGKMLETRKYKGQVIGNLCAQVFEPIQEEYRGREMQMFPNDPSSFE